MKLIAGKNDSGKTRELIRYSLDTGIPIFALYDRKAESIRAKAISYFNKPVQVLTPEDIAQNSYDGELLVDDIEKAFSMLLADFVRCYNFTIAGATITED